MNRDGNSPAAYPVGIDTVWIGSDSRGHVAAFVTAGEGSIPVTSLARGPDFIDSIEPAMLALPRIGQACLLVSFPRPDDYVALAERGLFAFDWRDVHSSLSARLDAYQLTAVPSLPVTVARLPQPWREVTLEHRMVGLSFETLRPINATAHLRCLCADGDA